MVRGIILVVLAALPIQEIAFAAGSSDRPNVVLVMADDLGFETIGANGGTSYRTPVLDSLAAKGTRFTNCYVQPLCTPTRVQLMTGAYNVRNYIMFGEMDPKLKTFGNLFQDAGYVTGIVGKWQLGRDLNLPKTFGFDEYCLWQHLRRPPRYANPGLEINGVEKDFENGEYGPELVQTYAEEFIARHKGKPFFLYYPMMLTHSPYQPTPDSPDWNPKNKGEKVADEEKHFGDMVEYMDKMIGRLMKKLQDEGLDKNTFVFFLGDNGTGRGVRSRMGDRVVVGGKGLTKKTGMHVPLIVHWPEGGKPGIVSDDLVDSTDILPTICQVAGIEIPASMKVDGRSFLPQVKGETGSPREWIYSWYCPRGENLREFAFNRDYKLYRTGEFYDLRRDPEEKHPLNVGSLAGEAKEDHQGLSKALAQFDDARPEAIQVTAAEKSRPRKGKRARQE